MTKLFDISGKVAIVTGASRGIGQAIAERFAGAGAKVVISSRKQEALDTVAEQIRNNGGEVLAIAAHNGDKAALQALVEKTVETYGGVDILVNNAATNPHFGSLLEASDSLWEKTIQVNIMGNIWLCQAVVPHMRNAGGGKIINVASIVGMLRPGQYQGIYSATKAAVTSITRTLAMELGGDNIQVNAIAPGLIKTAFARVLWENDELRQTVEARTPAGRIGLPEDIAGMAHFLAAPESNYCTGEIFVVDGGMTIGSL
ncbi:MAG: SDR family oxidoreductase [Chloroflexi bacterium]|nr:MAG: SDR family oxidoreductase [Chloroflexota bacterium]